MSRLFAITSLLGAALASSAALAQAPEGVLDRPSAEAFPNLAGGEPQLEGERNAQARRGTAPDTTVLGAGPFTMDLDADGVITRAEWDAYHAARSIPAASTPNAVPNPGEEPPYGATPK